MSTPPLPIKKASKQLYLIAPQDVARAMLGGMKLSINISHHRNRNLSIIRPSQFQY